MGQSYKKYLNSKKMLPLFSIFIQISFSILKFQVKTIIFITFVRLFFKRRAMKKEYSFEELLHKAASYCSISEHCVMEVEDKLTAWGISPKDKQKIIDRLVSEDFINEKRFCNFFVKDKFRFNKWGKIKISYALKQKGISNELINKALATIDDGEYEEMLGAILKTKLVGLKYEYEFEKQGKLFRFAQSRGFENNVIDRVLRTL